MNGNGNALATRGTQTEILGPDGEVLDFRENPSALEAITRAEIDIQISTANLPRSARSRLFALQQARLHKTFDRAVTYTAYTSSFA